MLYLNNIIPKCDLIALFHLLCTPEPGCSSTVGSVSNLIHFNHGIRVYPLDRSILSFLNNRARLRSCIDDLAFLKHFQKKFYLSIRT